MKRGVLAAVIAAALIGIPGRAESNMWDCIQDLSGPGPSNGHGNVVFTWCPERGAGAATLMQRDRDVTEMNGLFQRRPACYYFDLRRFENPEEDNFPAKVKMTFHEAGLTWKLLQQGQLEGGFGAGAMRSESNGVKGTHFTLTVFRLAAQPLYFIPSLTDNKWPSVLKWYYRVTLLPGRIDATDFGVPLGTGAGQSTFSTNNDVVRSAGFFIDLLEPFRN
jgi:hypothetical protein